MPTESAFNTWTGRHDGEGPEHARWHEVVALPEGGSPGDHLAVLGFRSDEGVRRNSGRVGAAEGPAALRRALAPLALHGALADGRIAIVDRGDAVTEGEDLESGQDRAAALITAALDAEDCRLTVVLGGGHETAWASYRGLMGSKVMGPRPDGSRPRWGVLNLDAHFDLRREPRPTSGTAFLQMADAEAAVGAALNYAVVGIAEPSNTGVLFQEARRLGVRWMTDLECEEAGIPGVRRFVEDFAADLDVLYLTVDLDVLPAAVAPGVSAPAAMGVATPIIAAAAVAAAASGKLALLDIVELNPSLDVDSRTAKSAARLIDETVRVSFGARAPESATRGRA
ncbi:formiminoglutamase [Tessaracoccus bendigoensis DSM 12906]|uniref:Formimidoylglutamase n=1 Tax=Tessaracoccus bendigoensis DSM 12906 TaxID=1123357 RepID=A0A1M6FKU3_9ACTN|nr:formimidoylglutamase [Tessaracoccus bendigoensis]SHI98317.1 formiminoglutamase [Tessaracoccus bendigoensis DSM 12906]